jgi:hypothetical protein
MKKCARADFKISELKRKGESYQVVGAKSEYGAKRQNKYKKKRPGCYQQPGQKGKPMIKLLTKIISRARKPRQLCRTYIIEPRVRRINPRELDPSLKEHFTRMGIYCRN